MELRILLAEDNEDDVAMVARAIERSGVAAHLDIARDGTEALVLLNMICRAQAEARQSPTFFILDLKLPGVDGLEVLRAMRTNRDLAGLPVVILTGSMGQTLARQ